MANSDKCSFNGSLRSALDQSLVNIYEMLLDKLDSGEISSWDEIPSEYMKLLKEQIIHTYNPDSFSEISEAILDILDSPESTANQYVDDLSFLYDYSPNDLFQVLNGSFTSNTPTETKTETKEEDISEPTAKVERQRRARLFLTENYRTSVGALRILRQQFYRGIKEALMTGETSFRRNNDLLKGVIDFQEDLLQTILDYLETIAQPGSALHTYLLNEHSLYTVTSDPESGIILQYHYTNVLEELLQFKEMEALLPELFTVKSTKKMTVSKLDKLYENYNKPNNEISRQMLDAYNAYFLLRHFDDMLKEELPEVEVKRNLWNKFDLTGVKSKYSFGRMAHTSQGWNDSEKDVNVAEKLSAPVKLMINDIDVYNWHSEQVRPGAKLGLANFNRIISTIKKIASNHDALTTFADPFLQVVDLIWGEKRKYKNLFEIIGDLNNDPTNFRHLILLMVSDVFWDPKRGGFKLEGNASEKSLRSLNLEDNDRSLIWSLYKGLFEDSEGKNLRALEAWKKDRKGPKPQLSLYEKWKNNPDPANEFDYQNFITQTCATIEALQLQQYRLNEDKSIVSLTLRDDVNRGARKRLELEITGALSPLLKRDFQAILDRYNPKVLQKHSDDAKDAKFRVDDYLFTTLVDENRFAHKVMHLSIGDFDVAITMDKEPGDINITRRRDGKHITKEGKGEGNAPFTVNDLESLIPFISDALPVLELENDHETGDMSPVLTTYLTYSSNKSEAIYNLLNLAAHAFSKATVQLRLNDELSDMSLNAFRKEALSYFGETLLPAISQSARLFKTLVSSVFVHTLLDLNTARKVISEIYGDNVVRDSEGKSISQIGTSMLTTKWEGQIFSLNKKPNSASRHFALWNTTGLFRDCLFTREYAGKSSLKATKMNVTEQTVSLFVYDFLGGFIQKSNTSVGERFVSLMPSILSDKSRILKLILDFNSHVKINGKDKSLKEFTAQDWKDLAARDLGTYYLNMYKDAVLKFKSFNNDYIAKHFTKTVVKQVPVVDAYTEQPVIDPFTNLPLTIEQEVEVPAFTCTIEDNFESFNKYIKENNLDADKFFHELIAGYQEEVGPIEFIDQLHYISKGGKLHANRLIISEINRFSKNGQLTLHYIQSITNIKHDLANFAVFVNALAGAAVFDIENNVQMMPLFRAYASSKGTTMLNLLLDYALKYELKTGEHIDLNRYFNTYKTGAISQKTGEFDYTSNLGELLSPYWMREIANSGVTEENGTQHDIYVTNDEFWQIKQDDLIKDFLINLVSISTTDSMGRDITSPELALLSKWTNTEGKEESWKKSGTGDIVIAKLEDSEGKVTLISKLADVRSLSYEKDGKTIRFGNEAFSFYEYAKVTGNKFTINPWIELWNASDYAIGQEYMNSTVGTHLNHPAKKQFKNKSDLINEAERWLAQVKRNVSLSASKHSFAMNMLNGIRDEYRIVVIDDDTAVTFNGFGLFNKKGAKPFDGATIVCGANNYLENYSLGGDSAGVDKKQFVHAYKEDSGSGIIIKTAGFAITCDRIRDNEFFERLNRKMMEGIWTLKDGKTPWIPIDITKNFYGQNINYKPMFFYDEASGKYFQINGFRKENIYTVNYGGLNIQVTSSLLQEMQKQYLTESGEDVQLENFENGDIVNLNVNGTWIQTLLTNKKEGAYQRLLLEVDSHGINVRAADPDTQLEVEVAPLWVTFTDSNNNPIIINNNYALWELFGGKNVMEIQEQSDAYGNALPSELVDSESSFINLVKAMNSLSEDLLYDAEGNIIKVAESLKDVHLNLKFSNVDYIVTAGAIKQGAANINSKNAYYDPNYKWTTMTVSMRDSGIQLDAEHHADDSTLSIMTLVVNALCARGYTLQDSGEVYQAMKALTEDGIKDYLAGLEEDFVAVDEQGRQIEGREALRDAIASTIVKSLRRTSERDGNLVLAIAEEVVQAAKQGLQIKARDLSGVPTSHPAMFKLLSSAISSALTAQAIKIKFPGVLAVLNPSNRIHKLYGNRLRGSFRTDKNKGKTLLLILDEMPILEDVSEIQLGHYYKVTDVITQVSEVKYIETPYDYWKLRNELRYKPVQLLEWIMDGRDLATYQINFLDTNGNKYNMWDLDSIRNLYKLRDLGTEGNLLMFDKDSDVYLGFDLNIKIKSWIYRNEETGEAENIPVAEQSYILNNNNTYDQYKFFDYILTLWLFNKTGEINKNWVEKHVQSSMLEAILNDADAYINYVKNYLSSYNYKPTGEENASDLRYVETILKRDLQKTLANLNTSRLSNNEDMFVNVNGHRVQVNKKAIKTSAYELIMPKIYATRFGLKVGDSLSDVLEQGSEFFLQRLAEKWSSVVRDSLFDIELKHSDGKHVYIVQRLNGIPTELTVEGEPKRSYDEGKYYRDDPSGEHLHLLSSETDEVYYDTEGHEIIVTDNVDFFLNEGHFNNIRLSNRVLSNTTTFSNLFLLLKELDNSVIDAYTDALEYKGNRVTSDMTEEERAAIIKKQIEVALEINTYSDPHTFKAADLKKALKNKETLPSALRLMVRSSKEMFASFEQSLDILAARIPAQSMLSFMAMKVVAFDNSNLNSAYVNYWQIWLQGSDFDIDKVSLLGYAFSKTGKFIGWSKFFNTSSKAKLEASKKLPFPTGKQLKIEVNDDEKSEWITDLIDNLNSSDPKLRRRSELFYDIFTVDGSTLNDQKYKGKYKKDLTAEEIEFLADIFREIKDNGGIISIPSKANLDLPSVARITALQSAYNDHNLSIAKSHNSKDAIINFISTYMFDVSRNPINLVLSLSSVDDMTEVIKGLAKKSLADKKTSHYAPGNVENKMETLILTLTGKDNTGIVASAMKTFEALSYYYNNRVAEAAKAAQKGDYETALKIANLPFKKGGISLCGLLVNMLANTWTDQNLETLVDNIPNGQAIVDAINNVNNDIDAFLLVSALLSLSTDNAKDPTLSKINASPEMIGLYTAGVAMGLTMELLTQTVMSNSGNIVNGLLHGNVFNDTSSRQLGEALTYLKEGPKLTRAPRNVIKALSDAIKLAMFGETNVLDVHMLSRELRDTLAKKGDKVEMSYLEWFKEYEKRSEKEKQDIGKYLKDNNKTLENLFDYETKVNAVVSGLSKVDLNARQIQDTFKYLITKGRMADVSRIIIMAAKTEKTEASELFKVWAEVKKAREEFKSKNKNASDEEIEEAVRNWHELLSTAHLNNISHDARIAEVRFLNKLLDEYWEYNRSYNVINSEYLDSKGKRVNVIKRNAKGFYMGIRKSPEECKFVGQSYLDGNKAYTLLSYENEKEMKKWLAADKETRGEMPEIINPVFSEGIIVYRPIDSIYKLSEINTEMGRLREKLSLNLGMPNTFAEQLSTIRKFELTILDRLDEMLTNGEVLTNDGQDLAEFAEYVKATYPNGINLDRFIRDEAYLKLVVADYEKIKCAFNVMDAVLEVPHYKGYLETLNAMYEAEKLNALIYRKVAEITPQINDVYRYKGKRLMGEVAKRVQAFFSKKLNDAFLKANNTTIVLSPGSLVFTKNGRLITTPIATPILLGTDWGNASFKLWVEKEVILNLKNGTANQYEELPDGSIMTDSSGKVIARRLSSLKPAFIRHLVPTTTDRTLSGNATVSYTLPVSMLPRSEQEQLLFKKFKLEFNSLSTQSYYYQYLDPTDGKMKLKSIPLLEIFFYYNMVVYGTEATLKSLTTLFEDLLRDGSLKVQNDYNQFIADFDKYENFTEGVDYSLNEVIKWCAPIADPQTSTLPFIRTYDRTLMLYILLERQLEDNGNYYDEEGNFDYEYDDGEFDQEDSPDYSELEEDGGYDPNFNPITNSKYRPAESYPRDNAFFLNYVEDALEGDNIIRLDGNSHVTFNRTTLNGKPAISLDVLYKPGDLLSLSNIYEETIKERAKKGAKGPDGIIDIAKYNKLIKAYSAQSSSSLEKVKNYLTFTPLNLIDIYYDLADQMAANKATNDEGVLDESLKAKFKEEYLDRAPTLEDFIVVNEARSIDGLNSLIPSRELIQAIINDLFNMCP